MADYVAEKELSQFLSRAVEWNLNAQWTENQSRGFVPKVTFPMLKYTPYPEITGYGASLYAKLFRRFNDKKYFKRAVLAADALAALQLPSGGFASASPHIGCIAFSFDHAMIANGLIDCYFISKEEKYLKKAGAALDFLLKHQDPGGMIPSCIGNGCSSEAHSNIAKSIIPLVKLYDCLSDDKYLKAAEKLASFTIATFQKQDGRFSEDSNNPDCNRFHFLCYALEGLIALESFDPRFFENIQRSGDYLFNAQRGDGAISYAFTSKGITLTKKVDISATAQTVRILLFLYHKTHKKEYNEGAQKALKYLMTKQHATRFKLTNGGLPFGYHNLIDSVCVCSWATQFAADSALLPDGKSKVWIDF
jgi:hypothetical protein